MMTMMMAGTLADFRSSWKKIISKTEQVFPLNQKISCHQGKNPVKLDLKKRLCNNNKRNAYKNLQVQKALLHCFFSSLHLNAQKTERWLTSGMREAHIL